MPPDHDHHQPAPSGRDGDRLLRRLNELERRLRDIELELDHAQRLAGLGMFAGAIAHEFNNLLTPIVNAARIAMAHPGDTALAEKALRRTVESGDRAARITGAILGYLSDDRSDAADVLETIQQTLACLARDPSKDGVETVVAVGEGCTAAIAPGALQQVLLNLVVNALRAIRSTGAGGRLTIRAERSTWNRPGATAEAPCVRITIRDSGPGIPRAVRERMFEPFIRPRQAAAPMAADAHGQGGDGVSSASGGSQSPGPHVGGTGLGLAICKRLIESAGGEIALGESSERGTTFAITLPIAAAGDARAAA